MSNEENPLNLSKGSIRAIIALSIVAAFVAVTVYLMVGLTPEVKGDLAKVGFGALIVEAVRVGIHYFEARKQEG